MPYRWQVQEGDRWNALPDNETIEKEYCDPSNTYRYSPLNRTVGKHTFTFSCHRKYNYLFLFGFEQLSGQIVLVTC